MAKSKKKKAFKACKGARISNNTANLIGRYIEKEFGGTVTPEQLLDSARQKNSEIHDLFDWNDTTAAEKYRLEQARYYLRVVVVVEHDTDVRAFHNVVVNIEDDSTAYVSLKQVRASEDFSQQIIKQALDEAVNWQKRYEVYRELAPIRNAIKKTVKQLTKRRK